MGKRNAYLSLRAGSSLSVAGESETAPGRAGTAGSPAHRPAAPAAPPPPLQRLGCNAELIVDEFGEKLMEELDYVQEARNIEASSFND